MDGTNKKKKMYISIVLARNREYYYFVFFCSVNFIRTIKYMIYDTAVTFPIRPVKVCTNITAFILTYSRGLSLPLSISFFLSLLSEIIHALQTTSFTRPTRKL